MLDSSRKSGTGQARAMKQKQNPGAEESFVAGPARTDLFLVVIPPLSANARTLLCSTVVDEGVVLCGPRRRKGSAGSKVVGGKQESDRREGIGLGAKSWKVGVD